AAMVIPFGGSNVVALTDSDGLTVSPPPYSGIEIHKVDATEFIKKRVELNIDLSNVGDDPERKQYRDSMMPALMGELANARYFRMDGKKRLIDFRGVMVQATAGGKVKATLRVLVLAPREIKIAIRNVLVRNPNKKPVRHRNPSRQISVRSAERVRRHERRV